MSNSPKETELCRDCGQKRDNNTSRCLECWKEVRRERRTAHHYYIPSDEEYEEQKYPGGGEERIKPLNF
jgi:predicted amidophosphoribosyltransferase